MSYFPSDIPYMSNEELGEHGINAKRERGMNDLIQNLIQRNEELKEEISKTNIELSKLNGAARDDLDKQLADAYQRGLNDAWEAANRIVSDERLDCNTLLHVFNSYNFKKIFRDFSASEVIEKLKAYEEEQEEDEITAGDEVIYNNQKFIVFAPETEEHYASLWRHVSADHRECKKTGRHVDLESILEEMKDE